MIERPQEALPGRLRGRRPLDEADALALGAHVGADLDRGAERWSVLRGLLLGADVVSALVGGMAAAAVGGFSLKALLAFTIVVAVAWPTASFVCGLYTAEDLRSWASGVADVPRLMFALLLVSWPLFAAATVLAADHPAVAALVGSAGTAVLGAAARGVARAIAHQSEPLRQRTVIVGSGLVAGQVAEKLANHPEFGLVPIGVVDDDVHKTGHPDLPTLGTLESLDSVLAEHGGERVIIAFSAASHERLLHAIRVCRDRQVAVDVVPRLFEFLDGARSLDQLGGLPLLSIGAHSLTRSSQIAKRVLDVAMSGAALLFFSPLLLALAVAIKLDSRGPVIYRQARAGRRGTAFSLLKFRSMVADADLVVEHFRDEGVVVKGGHDPRITRTGRLMRRYSLDELPQLGNVLKGDMSLVGPRPLVLSEAEALAEDWHERRLDLRPGMTGLWQVSGRSHIPFSDMLRFDYQYVAGWSLARDLEILLSTLPVVLSGRGAF